MSDLALFLVRIGFLVVMWLFVFSIISVIRADLFGQRVFSKVAAANAPKVVSAPTSASGGSPIGDAKVATKLVVTEGARKGLEIALRGREITIGRSEDSDLIVDDEFASTYHAKLVILNGEWMLQDLNSTNGTYLDGAKVTTPTTLKLKSTVRVGKTSFELRA
jgi:hypothetical protein